MLRGSREKIKHQGVFKHESPLGLCSQLMNAQSTRQMPGEKNMVCRKVHFIKPSPGSPGRGKCDECEPWEDFSSSGSTAASSNLGVHSLTTPDLVLPHPPHFLLPPCHFRHFTGKKRYPTWQVIRQLYKQKHQRSQNMKFTVSCLGSRVRSSRVFSFRL